MRKTFIHLKLFHLILQHFLQTLDLSFYSGKHCCETLMSVLNNKIATISNLKPDHALFQAHTIETIKTPLTKIYPLGTSLTVTFVEHALMLTRVT